MMMRVRTITAMMHLHLSSMDEQIERASEFLGSAKDSFSRAGIEVQTLRVSTQPYQAYLLDRGSDELVSQIVSVDRAAAKAGVDLVSIGFASSPDFIALVPEVLRRTERVSLSSLISSRLDGVLEDNIAESARTIREVSRLSEDGIGNFNFACLGNCPSGIPFFPASHHFGEEGRFSIGLESGGTAISSLRGNGDRPPEERVASDYWRECLRVQEIALGLAGDYSYLGIDTSWNPGLSEDSSVARAVSMMAGCEFGSPGTLSACAAMTRIVKEVHVKRCGYQGLMLPVLEDLELGRAADEGRIGLQSLLSYSAVCGTGLDAVPVPGDADARGLASVLRDVAALSCRLDKPLSARLLPAPGRKAGDRTAFDSPYISNCSVLPLS